MLVLGKNSKSGNDVAVVFNGDSEMDSRNQIHFVAEQASTWYSGYLGGVFDKIDYSKFFFLVKNTADGIKIQAKKLTQPKMFFYHPNDLSDTFVSEQSIKIVGRS